MTLLESIISPLIIAIISALTFVAYKHPTAYKKLLLPILIICIVLDLVFTTWEISISVISSKLLPLIGREKITEAELIIDKHQIFDNPMYLSIIFILIVAFLFILNSFPHLFGKNDKEDDPE